MQTFETTIDLFHRFFVVRYQEDNFQRSWLTEYYPWLNGYTIVALQIVLLLPQAFWIGIMAKNYRIFIY